MGRASRDLSPATSALGWRPITSAPKDGTHVLLAGLAHGRAVIGYYWTDGDLGEREPKWVYALSSVMPRVSGPKPTHWMPLPALPSSRDHKATGHD